MSMRRSQTLRLTIRPLDCLTDQERRLAIASAVEIGRVLAKERDIECLDVRAWRRLFVRPAAEGEQATEAEVDFWNRATNEEPRIVAAATAFVMARVLGRGRKKKRRC